MLVEAAFRDLGEPLLAEIRRHTARGDTVVTVVLPELIPAHWWENILHNQTAFYIKRLLLFEPQVVVTSVPFHLRDAEPPRSLLARRPRSLVTPMADVPAPPPHPRRGPSSSACWSAAPFSSAHLEHTLLPKVLALPVFASDALSSVAYATERDPASCSLIASIGAAGLRDADRRARSRS